MSTVVPPSRTERNAWSATAATPIASSAQSTPPGTIARICSAGSPAPGSTACVAPMSSAISRLAGSGSTAISGSADTSRAPRIAARPTPPQPKTATDSPGRTFARRVTDITPVVTPHPRRQASAGLQPIGHGDRAVRRHHRVVGERRHQRQMMDALRAAMKPGRPVAHRARVHAGGRIETEVRATLEAEAAAAARRRECQDHVLADAALGHAVADGLDHARALVAEDDRERRGPLAVHVRQVAAADARCQHRARAPRRGAAHRARPL